MSDQLSNSASHSEPDLHPDHNEQDASADRKRNFAGLGPVDPSEGVETFALPFPVVGVGASAGEEEACFGLLQHLPSDTGMAFVLLESGTDTDKRPLAGALSAHTRMPVQEIRDGLRPEPNHVYVLSSASRVALMNGAFVMEPLENKQEATVLIDSFLYSLAAEQKSRAIGVVLSGLDGDGALGLKTVKGVGGVSIVQQPDTARHPSMPQNSILSDHVDLVLPLPAIARELARLAEQFGLLAGLEGAPEPEPTPNEEQHFSRILQLLRSVSGVDFRLYRQATLRRRIARRMMLKRMASWLEYAAYLQVHRGELADLQEDLLINVTQFFRDEEVFQALGTEVLPRILENRRPDQQLRIWVAGCSTGEEVYSLAICLLEYMASTQHIEPPIQIFGTDASERSINKARAAVYTETITRYVSPERLRRYFVKVDQGYQIGKRVRDLCIFARQNLCSDPPFSKLDLVSCRNVLIYLGTELQRQVIPTFHYSLRPDGFLLLGLSESIREYSDLFTVVNRKQKIYAKLPAASQVSFNVASTLRVLPEASDKLNVTVPKANVWNEAELQRTADRIVLARHGPPGVIVNERLEVVQTRGHTAPYLEVAPGTSTFNLLRMLRSDLVTVLRQAISYALERDTPVQIDNVPLHELNDIRHITVEVLPIHGVRALPRYYLILFVEPTARTPVEPGLASGEPPTEISPEVQGRELEQLRQDLAATRNYLRSLIDERDSRNQELVTANEEAQSANEELQSANEELETAKEELQSANEELNTLNEELQNRNLALTQAGNDLANLLNSINIPVLMLNHELQIRSYTPPAQRLMNVRPSDIGRPVGEIRLNLQLENIELIFAEVLDTLAIKEVEAQDREGRWHILRARPYRTADNRIEGVVAVLLDVDQVRRTQNEMQAARDFAQTVIESAQTPLVVLNQALEIRTANAAFRSLSGKTERELSRQSFCELTAVLWGVENLRSRLEELQRRPSNGNSSLKFEHETVGPPPCALRFSARSVQLDGSNGVLVTLEDITVERQAERLAQHERERLMGQMEVTSQALDRSKEELRALAASLFTTQEETARGIARELHDDLGQRLARLELSLSKIRVSPGEDMESLNQTLAALHEQASGLSQDLRQISHQLHPSILDDLGLAAALKSLVSEFGEREGMLATCIHRNLPGVIPREAATVLYRIAQEALRNVAKHAGKTHVKVFLSGVKGGIRLSVRDFGDGFDMNEMRRQGLGLLSMEERVRLVDGQLSVRSEPGEGTTVEVTVPLPSAPG